MRPGKHRKKAIRIAVLVALGVLSAIVAGGLAGWPEHIATALDVVWI